jgi:hypothetical protein
MENAVDITTATDYGDWPEYLYHPDGQFTTFVGNSPRLPPPLAWTDSPAAGNGTPDHRTAGCSLLQ